MTAAVAARRRRVAGVEVDIRPMRLSHLEPAERSSDRVFLDADRRARRIGEPEPQPRSPAATAQWIERMAHFLDVDPAGCWVAEAGRALVGFAISQNRGGVWFLATYGVLPGYQGDGIGKRLLGAALAHAEGRPGLFSSTTHPAATRR